MYILFKTPTLCHICIQDISCLLSLIFPQPPPPKDKNDQHIKDKGWGVWASQPININQQWSNREELQSKTLIIIDIYIVCVCVFGGSPLMTSPTYHDKSRLLII